MDILPNGGDGKTMSFRKRINKSRFMAAANRDSFYVILFLCLVLLAATAVWVTRNNLEYFSRNNVIDLEDQMRENYEAIDDTEPRKNSPAVLIGDGDGKEQKEPGTETGEPLEDNSGVENNKGETGKQNMDKQEANRQDADKEETGPLKDTAVKASSTVQKSDGAEERMIVPLLGKICMDYGKDSLVYSKTLEQWTTHHGIDIAASIGTPVKAVKSGTITEVANHSALGIMITIDHGDGLVTRYANLQNGNMVKEGQVVEQGKVISGVGNTAEFEIGDVPHLHFEVIKDGEHRDPKLYLPNM